jgi:uncharacterized membrane protein
MTGTLGWLSAATAAFVAGHFLLSSRPVRRTLVALAGEMAFLGFYSAVAVTTLVWAARAYAAAPVVDVWLPPVGLRHLSLALMPFACVLLVAGVSTPSPTAVALDPQSLVTKAPAGIQKVTRHPVMWAFVLWGIAHLLANGDAASMIFFGGLTFLALAGAAHIDRRRGAMLGRHWRAFADQSSFVPLAAVVGGRTRLGLAEIGWWRIAGGIALYGLLLAVHSRLFGVSPLAV